MGALQCPYNKVLCHYIIPIIEGSFKSALHPGCDRHAMISVESGSAQANVGVLTSRGWANFAGPSWKSELELS